MERNRIEINIGNGMKIVAEQNPDSTFDREIYIGIENSKGAWIQDLAIVRQDYKYEQAEYGEDELKWKDDMMEVLVWGNPNNEDWTNSFQIGVWKEEE